MSEMVERVARAIYEDRNGPGATPWPSQRKPHKAPYLRDAMAAIGAMRSAEFAVRDDTGVIHELRGAPMDTWRYLIDAALK